MNPPTDVPTSGPQLLADFQAAFLNAATASVAKEEAERTENMILQQLSSATSSGYLQPENLNPEWQAGITRESIDAHIKKAQADQLNTLHQTKLAQMTEQDNGAYKHRKIRLRIVATGVKPIEAVWFDPQTGYRTSEFKAHEIAGTIEEVLLDRNALVIKPTFWRKRFTPSLQVFIVYIIDPATVQPMVEIVL